VGDVGVGDDPPVECGGEQPHRGRRGADLHPLPPTPTVIPTVTAAGCGAGGRGDSWSGCWAAGALRWRAGRPVPGRGGGAVGVWWGRVQGALSAALRAVRWWGGVMGRGWCGGHAASPSRRGRRAPARRPEVIVFSAWGGL